MIDTFHIADKNLNTQVFYNTGSNIMSWQVWQKPNNVNFVHFTVLGAGGGGGGGVGGGLATARRGGAGGGSAGVTFGLFAASTLPDTLYLQIGQGGSGGIGLGTSSNGGNGALSFVSVAPDSAYTITNVLLASGAVAAGGGQSGGNGGVAGVAGTVWAGANSLLFNLGHVVPFAGQAGAIGQTTPVPANIGISGITTGGASGAGTNGATPQNGGSIIGVGFINTVSGGPITGGTGSGGYMSTIPSSSTSTRQPMLFTGGGGGASANATTGGDGGNGAYGSGGGGGGAGISNLAGNGGKGGDGLIIITCW